MTEVAETTHIAEKKEQKHAVRRRTFGEERPKTKPISEAEQKWLDEEVEVEFYNLEEPGVINKFSYGTTKDFTDYTLFHGGRYTLPRKVVKHIESRQTPIWSYEPDGQGRMAKKQTGWKPRFQCRQVFV